MAFLLAVAAIVAATAQQVLSLDYEAYDVEVLRRELLAFEADGARSSAAVDVQPCTGEGSVPAAAQRQYSLEGAAETVRRRLGAEASALGWSATPLDTSGLPPRPVDIFGKGDQELWIEVVALDATSVDVSLSISGGGPC